MEVLILLLVILSMVGVIIVLKYSKISSTTTLIPTTTLISTTDLPTTTVVNLFEVIDLIGYDPVLSSNACNKTLPGIIFGDSTDLYQCTVIYVDNSDTLAPVGYYMLSDGSWRYWDISGFSDIDGVELCK